MRAVLAYAPRPGPLGAARPLVAAIYLMPLAAISFSFSSPLVLVVTGLTALGIAAASGATSSAMAPLRYGLALAFMVVLVNVIVAQRGDTVLLRGWDLPVLGQVDVTLEALAEGCILALRILVALLVFAVWSACVDPDRILKAIRPFAARSALTATLISRLVPLAAADHMRLAEAASLRGPAAAPVGRGALARRLVAGSLDRSVDVAATLELRGFGLPTRPTRVRPRRVHGEITMLLAGVLTIAAILAAAVSGAGDGRDVPVDQRRLRAGDDRLRAGDTPAGRGPVLLTPGDPAPAWHAPVRAGEDDMSSPILSFSDFHYTYAGAERPALRDVTVDVDQAELIVLAGRSGSGKSTLLRAACGLVPHFHGGRFGGEVVVDGRSTRDAGPAELALNVGFVAQEPESQVVSTTVRAELELPLELRGRQADEVARAVEEVALALGIEALLERTTDALSGGELQRVAIAAALVTRPPLLLLDEPTSQLDPVAGDELIGLLRRLNEEWGVTVVLGEHRLERCLPAADRVLALEAGALSFDGTPEDFGRYATASAPWLATPGMKMFELAGRPSVPARSSRPAVCSGNYRRPPPPSRRASRSGRGRLPGNNRL